MAVQLQQVVPFGRSLDEYTKIFSLSEGDRHRRILAVADGPASFNAEATQLGYSVLSIDPLYQFDAAEILARFEAVVDDIIEQVRQTPDDWVWSYHTSPDDLRANRERAIRLFLDDYEQGRSENRYRYGELPRLAFPDQSFDLCLCSHFLFLYSDHFDYEFHRDSVLELLRLSPEVRIFPLLTLMRSPSPYVEPLVEELRELGYSVDISTVEYELQKGGNEMLVICR